DTTQMSVKVRIHESHIEKVKKGLKAQVRVDAFPDRVIEGEVIKVGLLPDSQNRWMNPDLKVYLSTIKINGNHEWVKPGMSAKVEVMVKEIPDAIYVPIQAISPENNEHFAYLAGAGKPERRKVTIGEFNDEFIEIKSGLKEGEKVLLRAPSDNKEGSKDEKKADEKPATPATAPAAAKA
ncbi:MAG TPA: efflux RND transporter periplasmic adaptor subunit, partial [Methylomirabilota bacterium]|nr:efflux RND transporter periplasmic adaptor subunit [Methylomirabilota bacterium]